tara:strand:- start:2069 stop:2386 length:318 start_codon:yes stop_codon:yes gene_type:complete
MASGILGQAAPTATTNTTIYTVPASTVSVVNISIVNRGGSAATVRVALSATATPSDDEYIEYNTSVGATSVLERTGLVLDETKNVVVYASSADTSVSVYGLESAA